jgi:hypothetical protein
MAEHGTKLLKAARARENAARGNLVTSYAVPGNPNPVRKRLFGAHENVRGRGNSVFACLAYRCGRCATPRFVAMRRMTRG